ncbi:urea ABC transporter substrate-binding protein [Streptomyces spiroverticillatus]|uniref:Urea ABC transporter substrate-binding protein n=1 Tax=Streptomyces finlayi TaxID=67296 RepID=A0A918WZW3_9ACTN|nr:urea ABC transporter substrate-binding protein [Streptomyces finlayi]GHA16555.1 urea ABC transporter substrate-binding protein [Streptomyces spiroverticillatus]GHC98734.1 urea ABC transporter substrate-binding protein [Streptomyces finlayi]
MTRTRRARSRTRIARSRTRIARSGTRIARSYQRRSRTALAALLGAALLTTACTAPGDTDSAPVKVGVLHSATGGLAIAEKPLTDAVLLAVRELNDQGGVLGRRIEPVTFDTRSDNAVFAASVRRMLTTDGVRAVFGGYTSASRRTMVPLVEKHQGLLFFPTFYEGMEHSAHVVYTGATPNQVVAPAVKWFLDNRGKRLFLVGSDYIYPRATNAVVKAQLAATGGTVAGEHYLPLGEMRPEAVADATARILRARPDAIVSTVVGDTNLPFFKALLDAGATSRTLPVLSLVLNESELSAMDARRMAGNYVAMNYFQSVRTPENAAFVRRYRARYGPDAVISDPAEASYSSVMLWARAVRDAGSADPAAVTEALRGASWQSPGGTVFVDRENLHLWKTARLGRIRTDGQMDVVWESETVIHPVPYSPFRRRQDWNDLLKGLYEGWGGRWDRPPGGKVLPNDMLGEAGL